jgi:hypothetical protein
MLRIYDNTLSKIKNNNKIKGSDWIDFHKSTNQDDFSPHRIGILLRLKIIKKSGRICTLGTLATIQLLFLG